MSLGRSPVPIGGTGAAGERPGRPPKQSRPRSPCTDFLDAAAAVGRARRRPRDRLSRASECCERTCDQVRHGRLRVVPGAESGAELARLLAASDLFLALGADSGWQATNALLVHFTNRAGYRTYPIEQSAMRRLSDVAHVACSDVPAATSLCGNCRLEAGSAHDRSPERFSCGSHGEHHRWDEKTSCSAWRRAYLDAAAVAEHPSIISG